MHPKYQILGKALKNLNIIKLVICFRALSSFHGQVSCSCTIALAKLLPILEVIIGLKQQFLNCLVFLERKGNSLYDQRDRYDKKNYISLHNEYLVGLTALQLFFQSAIK